MKTSIIKTSVKYIFFERNSTEEQLKFVPPYVDGVYLFSATCKINGFVNKFVKPISVKDKKHTEVNTWHLDNGGWFSIQYNQIYYSWYKRVDEEHEDIIINFEWHPLVKVDEVNELIVELRDAVSRFAGKPYMIESLESWKERESHY